MGITLPSFIKMQEGCKKKWAAFKFLVKVFLLWIMTLTYDLLIQKSLHVWRIPVGIPFTEIYKGCKKLWPTFKFSDGLTDRHRPLILCPPSSSQNRSSGARIYVPLSSSIRWGTKQYPYKDMFVMFFYRNSVTTMSQHNTAKAGLCVTTNYWVSRN